MSLPTPPVNAPAVTTVKSTPPTGLLAQLVTWLAGRLGLVTTLHGVPVPFGAAIVSSAELLVAHGDVVELRTVDGSPADDLPLAIRVHPNDDPADPLARRYVRDDSPRRPWVPITGWPRILADGEEDGSGVPDLTDGDVVRYPRQPYQAAVAAVAKAPRS